jgi:Domain of unknown function (DUF4331)
MNKYVFGLAAAATLAIGLIGCNNSRSVPPGPGNNGGLAAPLPTNPPTSTASFVQIELLARPAVKEVFENFNDHKTTNAVEPYVGSPADPLQAEIKAFEDTVRPPKGPLDYGATLATILYPNEIAADLSNTTDRASYLGVETGGATGGKFGGRDLSDDVVGISLGALFGNTLSSLGVIGDDGEENAWLAAEHVAQNPNQAKTTTFPYAAVPH